METKQYTTKQQINLRGNQKIHVQNESKNSSIKNQWDTVKVVLREYFIVVKFCIRKQETYINSINLTAKELEKQPTKSS